MATIACWAAPLLRYRVIKDCVPRTPYELNRSSDGLATATSVLTAAASIEYIAFAPSDPSIVYVGAVGLLIYKSTDAGETFTLVADLRNGVLNATP